MKGDKEIPLKLNPNYLLTWDGEINTISKDVPLIIDKNKNLVKLQLNGYRSAWYDLFWLGLLCQYRVKLPEHFKHRLNTIRFRETKKNFANVCHHHVMVFNRPMEKDDWRIIPCYVDYEIKVDGTIRKVSDKKIVERNHIDDQYRSSHYDTVNIYNPLNNKIEVTRLHRLVALAWCENDDWKNKVIVNHIDGNKCNNHASNLEWVTYLGNSLHAVDVGLNPRAKRTRIRNFYTKEIFDFPSIQQAWNYIKGNNTYKSGYGNVSGISRVHEAHLFKGKWEIRLPDDNRPWYYEDKEEKVKKGKYIVTIEFPDGTCDVITDIRDLIKKYKLWNLSIGVPALAKVLKERNPTWKIKVEGDDHIYPVEARKVETGEVFTFTSIRELTRKLGMRKSFGTILSKVKNGDGAVYKGYQFRYKGEGTTTWSEPYYPPSINSPVFATNSETKEEIKFNSIRETARYFNVERSVIKYRLDTGKELLGFKFTYQTS